MTKLYRLVLSILSLVALCACVTVQSTRLGAGVIHPPVSADAVAIYLSSAQIHRPYEQVALLDASGAYDYTSEEKMFAKLRANAAALGANAIILSSVTEPTTGAKVAEWFIGVPADRRGKAIAIYVHP